MTMTIIRAVRYAIVLVALAFAAPGLASSDMQVPVGRFAVTAMVERLGAQPGLAWDKLHPAHQHLISRAHFIRCVRWGRGSTWHLRGIDYASTRELRVSRRGIEQTHGGQVWMRVRAT